MRIKYIFFVIKKVAFISFVNNQKDFICIVFVSLWYFLFLGKITVMYFV